jgi:hypothetical protein
MSWLCGEGCIGRKEGAGIPLVEKAWIHQNQQAETLKMGREIQNIQAGSIRLKFWII